MVSTRWQLKNVSGVSNVQLGSPRPSAESDWQVLRQLRATVKPPDGTNSNTIECVEEVRYDLVMPGESLKLCAKRNWYREQLAFERLAARGG